MPSQLQISRALAFERQHGLCCYCDLPMWLFDRHGPAGPGLMQCTAEHLRARSAGGGDEPANIAAAHAHCNRLRHRRKKPPGPARFRLEVRRRVQAGRWLPRPALAWAARRRRRHQPQIKPCRERDSATRP